MALCSVCRTENADGARFCNGCGSRLASPAGAATERKVISVLFCDLVGFTAASEGVDPEDVDRMLTAYFAMARAEVQDHGGVVEKFIGDAVVGVFGVPVVHEDDPERAVRAALRIVDGATGLRGVRGSPLRLRVGVNTGEALVRTDVSPGAGERFLAGDTINTASRIQSAAPEMGVAVGQATFEATRARLDFDDLPPAAVKGKSEPVAVWRARGTRADPGVGLGPGTGGRFIGRESELRQLTGLLDAVVASGVSRSAVIAGEAGLGKSRLVAELLAYAGALPVPVTWRQGRCLPYGTGVSFWALGEVVKAYAGVLETDPTTLVIAKLDAVLPEGDQRTWLRERLLPLVGVEAASRAERDEQFAAWRRFLELVAAERATVLVFEDLHWADEAMLAFLDDLVGANLSVPLFVVGTTRPDLFDRHPGFPAPGAATVRIDLAALSFDDTTQLVSALVDGAAIAPALQGPILERAGGTPLFVEEYLRLLRDRDLLVTTPQGLDLRAGTTLPTPGSIQSLLAARIDALPATWKAVLGDAAVIGKVFWAGAVNAMDGRTSADLAEVLDGLVRRRFVRPAAHSSMAGETEFTFGHILARDVAYAGLPRGDRVTRHVRAAEWIESKAADRIEDVADILAYHHETALALARATGADDQVPALEVQAFRALMLAGERAEGLDVSSAVAFFERALALAPPGRAERARALKAFGRAANQDGRYRESLDALDEAATLYREAGDLRSWADAIASGSFITVTLGNPFRGDGLREAIATLESMGPSPQLAKVLGELGAYEIAGASRFQVGLDLLQRALDVADAAGFSGTAEASAFRGLVLGFQGNARIELEDPAGFVDCREAIRATTAAGDSGQAAGLYINLAADTSTHAGPGPALKVLQEAEQFISSRGLRGALPWLEVEQLVLRFDTGEHDELVRRAGELDPRLEAQEAVSYMQELRGMVVRVDTLRGIASSEATLEWLEAATRKLDWKDAGVWGFEAIAGARLLLGQADRAREALRDALALSDLDRAFTFPHMLPSLVRTALRLNVRSTAEGFLEHSIPRSPYGRAAKASATALIAEWDDPRRAAPLCAGAAAAWAELGVLPEQAFALLGQGRCLLAIDQAREATPMLNRARVLFEPLRAAPAMSEIDGLLARVEAALA